MSRLATFFVKQYRRLQDLDLENLSKVNLFVGPNNCGKTSVLEAISLALPIDSADPHIFVEMLVARYHEINLNMFKNMFTLNEKPYIEIAWKIDTDKNFIKTYIDYTVESILNEVGKSNINKIEYNFQYEQETSSKKDSIKLIFNKLDKGHSLRKQTIDNKVIDFKIPYNYLSFSRFDMADNLLKNIDKLLEKNKRQDLINALNIFDKDIINFEIIGEDRTIQIFNKKCDKPLSLYDYGNGMYRTFFIITAALLSKDGILLIDEIEAGIHIKALKRFISNLLNVCQVNNVQLFMTTHSLDAVDTILEDCNDEKCLEDISIYHLRNTDKQTVARRYSGTRMLELRENIGFDVR